MSVSEVPFVVSGLWALVPFELFVGVLGFAAISGVFLPAF